MIECATAISTPVSTTSYNWDGYSGRPKHLCGDNIPWTNFKTKNCQCCRDIPKKPGEYCIYCDKDGSNASVKKRNFQYRIFQVKPCKISYKVERRGPMVFDEV